MSFRVNRKKSEVPPVVVVEGKKVYVDADQGAPQVFLGGSAAAWTQSFVNDRVGSKKSFDRRASGDDDDLLVRTVMSSFSIQIIIEDCPIRGHKLIDPHVRLN